MTWQARPGPASQGEPGRGAAVRAGQVTSASGRAWSGRRGIAWRSWHVAARHVGVWPGWLEVIAAPLTRSGATNQERG
jgi:hypothetical protein